MSDHSKQHLHLNRFPEGIRFYNKIQFLFFVIVKNVFILTETVLLFTVKVKRITGEGVECSSLTVTELEQFRLVKLFIIRIENLEILKKNGQENFQGI